MRWKTDQLQAGHAGGPEDVWEQEVMGEIGGGGRWEGT